MRGFLLFVFTIFLFGCHEPKKNYPIPSKKDINEIVKAIITQQSCVELFEWPGLGISKPGDPHYNALDNLALLTDLKKVTVMDMLTSDTRTVNIRDMLNPKDPLHFKKADSLYILSQFYLLKHFEVDRTTLKNVRFISNNELKAERFGGKRTPYYDISIPIFSLDQQQAYVQLNRYVRLNGAMGYMFILRKIKGQWKIVREKYTWMS
jgi:hypothetical protein